MIKCSDPPLWGIQTSYVGVFNQKCLGNDINLTQQVSKPPEQPQSDKVQSPAQSVFFQQTRFPRAGIFVSLVLVSVFILSSAVLLLLSLLQAATPHLPVSRVATSVPTQTHSHVASVTVVPDVTVSTTPPIFVPGNASVPSLQLPTGHYVLYEQQGGIYVVDSAGGSPQKISAPGYVYSQAVHPLITSSGQLLYAGNGIWLTDIFGGAAQQIALLAPNTVIASMALSSDGTTVAWSTEPAGGNGLLDIYAGPLKAPVKVFEQAASNCPCFRVFAFMSGSGTQDDTTLLLTDGQQSLGLWSLNLTQPLVATPQPLMNGNSPQGPLALTSSNVLLYSSYEGSVAAPTDNSVPTDVAILNYANSLQVTTVSGQPLAFNASQVILADQREQGNSAAYHWVTTPVFTLDGRTLIYVEFSSQAQNPYDRNNALFMVHINGTGKHLRVDKPQLLATSNVLLLELGAWLNDHILTFYGDGVLYAIDISTGAVATIAQTGAYARVIAVVSVDG